MYFKSPFYSLHGVVASEHPLASMVGASVLKDGGNAVDATVAVSFSLSVVLPHLSGIGGDFFALLMDPDGHTYFLNGSGYAPSRLTLDFMLSSGFSSMPSHGVYCISIPGLVDGLYNLWRKFGRLEWNRLILPSIKIARGFPATQSLCRAINNFRNGLASDRGSREAYLIDGKPPREGDIIAFKGLAKALESISFDPRCFYEGEIAESIVEYVNSLGGILELKDFRDYKSEFGTPISIDYRGRRVYEMPPNTQGITTLHILKLLEDFDLKSLQSKSIDRIKTIVDVAKTAYDIRNQYVTDARFMRLKVHELLSDSFIKAMKISLSNKTKGLYDGDTTFFAVADEEGWIVSAIQSIFHNFGSYITEPNFNVTLNSRASSFSLDVNHVNRLEPRKKPLHTLSAVLMDDCGSLMAVGISGGHYRPLFHSQLMTNIIDYELPPQEAIEHPRFQWNPGTALIEFEEGYVGNCIEGYELKKLSYPARMGVASIVEVKGRLKAGYTDIRGDGLPIGIV
ncbi:MAG: gamma-glutamyltransferase family protein [Candidatus Bathyarchaeia archaeon]